MPRRIKGCSQRRFVYNYLFKNVSSSKTQIGKELNRIYGNYGNIYDYINGMEADGILDIKDDEVTFRFDDNAFNRIWKEVIEGAPGKSSNKYLRKMEEEIKPNFKNYVMLLLMETIYKRSPVASGFDNLSPTTIEQLKTTAPDISGLKLCKRCEAKMENVMMANLSTLQKLAIPPPSVSKRSKSDLTPREAEED